MINFNHSQKQRGDTLVEVLVATVVIGMVIAAAYAITNRATRINQAAYERTDVSNKLKDQIERVRGIRLANGEAWTDGSDGVLSKISSNAPDYTSCDLSPGPVPTANAFFILTDQSDPLSSSLTDKSVVRNYGGPSDDPYPDDLFNIWIEAHQPSGVTDYVDIHARACWFAQGQDVIQKDAIILRLQI